MRKQLNKNIMPELYNSERLQKLILRRCGDDEDCIQRELNRLNDLQIAPFTNASEIYIKSGIESLSNKLDKMSVGKVPLTNTCSLAYKVMENSSFSIPGFETNSLPVIPTVFDRTSDYYDPAEEGDDSYGQ
jgi:hypothetical protein